MRIGAWSLDPPVFLAPMAGVSNRAFRVLARAEGARLCTTEMVSAKALVLGGARSFAIAELEPGEHPVAVQIAGSDPAVMAEAARLVERMGADIVDINMGCPVPKVVRNGDGSALLTDPAKAEAVARAVVEAVRIPVTVKMRAGWDREHITAPEVAERLEAAGVQAVAVHARTREDRYAGPVNWEYIRRVRERVSIPVIGNGDLDSPARALEMLEATGADGVMIGRAALGDP
ncbi:MAG: tRNA dihydrouridine synthase DusB, partial [Firmicutes bacterium]|nr:tRNA dihydrouridine synthase DusB [Bacillota bacterium]